MAGLQTEYAFTLPKGYVDADGRLHRHGTMRMATARDEIEPLRDPRIRGADDPYLTVLVLARVITELGTLPRVRADDVEGFFAADLAFLQDLYGIINFGDPADVAALQATVADATVDAAGDQAPDPADEPAPFDADAADDAGVGAAGGAGDEPIPSARRRGRIEEVTSTPAH